MKLELRQLQIPIKHHHETWEERMEKITRTRNIIITLVDELIPINGRKVRVFGHRIEESGCVMMCHFRTILLHILDIAPRDLERYAGYYPLIGDTITENQFPIVDTESMGIYATIKMVEYDLRQRIKKRQKNRKGTTE